MIKLFIKINKAIRSFRYAFNGILQVFLYENNAHFHLIATVLVVAVSFLFNITRIEWLWVVLAITLVWIMECINTAVEKLVDFVSPTYHHVAGKVKDIMAGAVLIAAFGSAIIGLIIFIPYIINCFNY